MKDQGREHALFPLTFGMLASITNGKMIRGTKNTPVPHVVFRSSEHLGSQTVYFLIPRYFSKSIAAALASRQIRGAVVPRGWEKRIPAKIPTIVVANADAAFSRLIHWQRKQSKAIVIGITGSAGKTTTKEMIASIVSKKYPTLKTFGNQNTITSLPGLLFQLQPQHKVAVLELSPPLLNMCCYYAKPKIGVLTNIGEAHIGRYGTVKELIRVKQQLVDGIQPGGILVMNADDPNSQKMTSLKRFRGRITRFGIKNRADVQATHIHFARNGMTFRVNGDPYFIPTWGIHNVYNALAAIAVAKHLGFDAKTIQLGLRTFRRPPMRLQPIQGINGFTLINDAYNANPTAMIAGLHVLKKIAGSRPTVAVLGDMLELGPFTISGHSKVGKTLAQLGISQLITIGPLSKQIAKSAIQSGHPPTRTVSFTSKSSALSYILKRVPKGAVLYFKASRRMYLENLIKSLCYKKSQ